MATLGVNYMMVLPAIQSRRNGMDENLRETIKDKKKNKKISKNVVVVVTSFDRITRNVKDLPFLKKNVYRVYEIRSGRMLTPDDYDNEALLAQTEIQIISERAKNRQRTTREKPSKNELKRRARNRLASAWDAIQMNPTNTMTKDQHNKVQIFIQSSQSLINENTWHQLSLLSKDMGGSNIMEDYQNEVQSNKELKLSRSHTFYYAKLFKCFEKVADNLVKEYLSAIYQLVQLTDVDEEEEQEVEEVEEQKVEEQEVEEQEVEEEK